MENLRAEEEKIIKHIINIFRLKKEQNDAAIKGLRNVSRLKKKLGIKHIVLRNIKNLFKYEKEETIQNKPIRLNNF